MQRALVVMIAIFIGVLYFPHLWAGSSHSVSSVGAQATEPLTGDFPETKSGGATGQTFTSLVPSLGGKQFVRDALWFVIRITFLYALIEIIMNFIVARLSEI